MCYEDIEQNYSKESVGQALQQLKGNRLRSFLSLLGISIGIFSYIGVLSAVDSLEDNIRQLGKAGQQHRLRQKSALGGCEQRLVEYMKRPNPDHEDYEAVTEKSRYASLTAYHVVIGFKTLKFNSNSVDGAILIGASEKFPKCLKLSYKGAIFAPAEYYYGANKIILGYKVAEGLFGPLDPIGRSIKLSGRTYGRVNGIIEQAGDDLINPLDFDDCIVVSYPNARGLANLKANQIFDATVTVKASDNVGLDELKDELTGILHAPPPPETQTGRRFLVGSYEMSMIASFMDSFLGC